MYNKITLMFKKLVSNIPFNPSLIEKIPEYRSSLRKEYKLRVIGLSIFLVAVLFQLYISIFPAQTSVTNSPNNLIYGGISNKTQLISDCINDVDGYQSMLQRFSINCNNLEQATNTSFASGSDHKSLFSLNRISYGLNSETQININNQKFWIRPLWEGSGLDTVKLNAFSIQNESGVKYYILNNSGNIVFKGQPASSRICVSLCPILSISARYQNSTNANNTTASTNKTIIYTLIASNPYKASLANIKVGTNFSSALTYSKINNLYGGTINNNYISWPAVNIKPGQTIAQNVSFNVLNKIPNTPLSSSDPNYYNMKMITTYGNTINIKLPWSISKYIELKINNGLPSMLITFCLIISLLLLIFITYFVCLNKLLLKELNNLKDDYLNGGKN